MVPVVMHSGGVRSSGIVKWLANFTFALLLGLAAMGHAEATSMTRAQTWLSAQIVPTGTVVQEQGSVALPLQVRAETAAALRQVGVHPDKALFDAIALPTVDTTEYRARQAIAAIQSGGSPAAHLDWLEAHAAGGGGFGAAPAYPANVQDSAWALFALMAGRNTSPEIAQVANWLLGQQQTDGHWALAQDEDGVVPTALVLQALQGLRHLGSVAAALANARQWLDGQRQGNGAWGSTERTAQALLAMLPALNDASSESCAIAALETAQLANGSWQDDAYPTALALRALWLAGQPATNPDAASIQGLVIDDATGLPLSGFRPACRHRDSAR
ncbi:hypothetical protein [Acidovorax sp. FG27]|uniref:hypothetical protein n=1 Tax=Acidovorax sp. FG27 TaxID=3133652 RepID=UPI0030E90FD0